ncbi:lipocalin [Taibaiella sp. KBW10]|uniref:lipocalin family protein n=1 Tax=Taibaiella sp. KBW10 TaxID=2153357 RepID=UPI000F5B0E2F|nr:lipocalin family protein [Taibaiella sp. KBW10]RQO30488.1 lipocalin [Taibaiella sp. KBW10]
MKNKRKWIIGLLGAATGTLVLSRVFKAQKPAKAVPVTHFSIKKYLGKWYEIARMDFKFERNMNNTTAEYDLTDEGKVRVLNRGYDTVKQQYKTATGIAIFAGDKETAALKVSFFGPFYSGYNVVAIDEEYQYALVVGESLKYMWILSRTKTIPKDIRKQYLQLAQSIGYDTDQLVWVSHQ